jgi:Na+-driven multidrug efflux pump
VNHVLEHIFFFNNFYFSPVNCLTDSLQSLGSSWGTGIFNMFSLILVIFWIKKKKRRRKNTWDIFITWRFRLTVDWISRQYIHHYFAKIKADFAT